VPPEVKDPVKLHAPIRKSMAWFGAVRLSSGKFVSSMTPKFNSFSFESYLETSLRHRIAGRRKVIVLDNAAYHHAASLRSQLRQYRAILRLLFLTPYSPHLAPVKRVWKLTRRLVIQNRYFTKLDELICAATSCFNRWRIPNPVLRRLCSNT